MVRKNRRNIMDSVNHKENRKEKCYKRKSTQFHEDQYSRHDCLTHGVSKRIFKHQIMGSSVAKYFIPFPCCFEGSLPYKDHQWLLGSVVEVAVHPGANQLCSRKLTGDTFSYNFNLEMYRYHRGRISQGNNSCFLGSLAIFGLRKYEEWVDFGKGPLNLPRETKLKTQSLCFEINISDVLLLNKVSLLKLTSLDNPRLSKGYWSWNSEKIVL